MEEARLTCGLEERLEAAGDKAKSRLKLSSFYKSTLNYQPHIFMHTLQFRPDASELCSNQMLISA